MPATLSPFRYIQVARYLMQWWLDTAPGLAARRKAAQERATRLIYAPKMRGRAMAAAAATAQVSEDDETPRARRAARHLGVDIVDKPAAAPDDPGVLLPRPDAHPDLHFPRENTEIYRLMNDDRAYIEGSMKAPREIIVLCHGLYGFSTATPIPLFPSLKLHYWASVLEVLRDRMGAKVVVVGVKGTGSIQERAEQMHKFLKNYLPRGVGVNFVAHSMGGLDCRHLISSIQPTEYKPLSLTTIATPHHGSPFMDWCAANIGVGSQELKDHIAANLPFTMKTPLLSIPGKPSPKDTFGIFTSALTNYLLNIFDSPAYYNLRTDYLRDHFNPATPDDPNVKYYSVAGRIAKMSVLHPLWFPKLVLDSAAEKGYPEGETPKGEAYEGNDGLVSVASSKWGEFLGVVDGCHHWDLRGEGGLWPATNSLKLSTESNTVLGLGTDIDERTNYQSSDDKGPGAKPDEQLNRAQHDRDLAAARLMSPGKTPDQAKSSSNGWDMAMVGQLVDWVGDLFPGDKKDAERTSQFADAQKEMDARKESQAERQRTVVRDKFDLARFYGGLMLRLREEGL
ncbi:unnamed protein product [Cutaneotrichosporon oleaginosum]